MARILLWSETFWPQVGGAEVLGLELIEALQRRGHELLVVVCPLRKGAPTETKLRDVEICRLTLDRAVAGKELEWLIECRRRVDALRRGFAPDLIHFWTVGTTAHLFLGPGRTLEPSLLTVHGELSDSKVESHTALGALLRRVSWVAPVSRAALARLRRQVPEITEHSAAIRNSLPLPSRAASPPPPGAARLLCLGNLEPHKGFDLALRAFAAAAPRLPGARLLLAGGGSARPALERQAAELGLGADRIEFLGPVAPDQVPELLANVHVVLMPSRTEGFGLVGLQAAQMARPLIAAGTGGLMELVEHGVTGLLVEPGDADAMEQALLRVLEPPDRARLLGEAARTRAIEHFGWEPCVDAYEQTYARLIDRRGHGDDS